MFGINQIKLYGEDWGYAYDFLLSDNLIFDYEPSNKKREPTSLLLC